MFDNIKHHTYLQLISVGVLMLISMIVFNIIAFVLGISFWGMDETMKAMSGLYENEAQISILKLMQIASQLSLFIVPPLFLWLIMHKDRVNYLGLSKKPQLSKFLTIIVLYIVSIPFLQYTMELNEAMNIGQYFPNMENWMRDMQDKNDLLITKFLGSINPMGLIVNLIVMAVLPAIGEELLFRGVLMNWLSKIFSNIHINILISAIIFSAIHFQFYGFIPRFILGVLLGYAYYFTQSIFVPMLLHFVNNAVTVGVYYWINTNDIDINPEEFGSVDSLYYVVISALFIVMMLWRMQKERAEVVGVP